MDKKIAFFHTTLNSLSITKEAFQKRFPSTQLINVLDDSILPEVITNNDCYTPGIVRRLVAYGTNFQAQGAVAAVCMCTTLTKAVEEAGKTMNIPFLTIDGPMLREAVAKGNKIAILITARTTRLASTAAIRGVADQMGRSIKTDTILVEGAFEALNLEANREKHDRLIEETARKAALDHDIIVLAQVTMASIVARLSDISVPVLTSIESGIEQLAEYLN